MSERETTLSPADKAIVEAAAREKSDLSKGTDTRVAKGDELTPVPRSSPLDQRKAIYASAIKQRDEQRDVEAGGEPGATAALTPEQVKALEAEAASGRIPIQNLDRAPVPAKPLREENGYVSIQLKDGNTVSVTKADLDRAGGEEGYRRKRELDAEALALARGQQDLARQRRELQESARPTGATGQPSPVQGGPAPGPVAPTGQPRNVAGASDAELEAQAARLAAQIYSGDEGAAKGALLEVLKTARSQGQVLTDRQAQERVETQPAAAQPRTTATVTDAITQAINDSINRMAIAEFPEICNDPVAKVATWEKCKELMKLPQNANRLAVDVARDACEWGQNKFSNSRDAVLERKRGLPNTSTASSATHASDEEPALSPADIVRQQQERRNFGRRIH